MLMTSRRRLRVAAGVLETGNVLFLKLLLRDRQAARIYPGRVYRDYLSLAKKDHWTSQSIFDFLPELATSPTPRITLEHVQGEGITTSVAELALMALVTRALNPRRVFEIGTFRGRTALNFALNSPDDCIVYTLDLPPLTASDHLGVADQKIAAMRKPGVDFEGSDVERKVIQLLGDSCTFDFSSYLGQMDLVFVDGGHTYELAANDTRSALQMCRPGGVILWHDFANYGDYHDVTRAVLDNIPDGMVVGLENTELAAYRAPG